MLQLPMTIKDITVNVTINFNNITVEKDKLDSRAIGLEESDVIVDRTNIKSLRKDEYYNKNPEALTAIIRKHINYSNRGVTNIKVTTKKYKDSDFYDVYYLPLPPFTTNPITDYIYGSLLNSIRLSTPDLDKKINLDLHKIGFDNLISKEFLNHVLALKNNFLDQYLLEDQIRKDGYGSQLDVLNFFNTLNCEINNDDFIVTSEIDDVVDFLSKDSKEGRKLVNYKNMALSNYESYLALGTFNNLLYNRPLTWPSLSLDQQKTLRLKLNSKRNVA